MPNPQRHLRPVREQDSDDDRERVSFPDYFKRLTELSDAQKAIANDISDLLRAAKSDRHSPAVLREVLKISRMDAGERDLRFEQLFAGLGEVGIKPDLGFYQS